MKLVLATRRSPLAVAQSETVAAALRRHGHRVELLPVVTTGDKLSTSGSRASGDDVKGMFVKELEHALLVGWADIAVHSAKDLPTALPDGLAILGVPERADPRDVLLAAPGGLESLRRKARVGTGSPRRSAQLLDERPDLVPVEVRGNIDTRIARWKRGDVDALVLAAAGLERLKVGLEHAVYLDPGSFVPAPGQGCLAIEGRDDRPDLLAAVAEVSDPISHDALRAERAFLAELGGGCQTPVGALARPEGEDALRVIGYLSRGTRASRHVSVTGHRADPEALGRKLAQAVVSP